MFSNALFKLSSAIEEFYYQRSFAKWKRDLTYHSKNRFRVAVRLSRHYRWHQNVVRTKKWNTRRYQIVSRKCSEKMHEKSVSAIRAALWAEKKSSEVALNIAWVERIRSENLRFQQHCTSISDDCHKSVKHWGGEMERSEAFRTGNWLWR